MKFEDKPRNQESQIETVTPQSAMNDYFADMFGSSEEDPLKKFTTDPSSEKNEAALSSAPHNLKAENQPSKSTENSRFQNEAPNTQAKRQKQTLNFTAPNYDEPELKTGRISPLIIPAAFPKLAPVKIKTDTEPKTITESRVLSEAKVETESKLETEAKTVKIETKTQASKVKPKLDAKTALALLEKQQSKLSTEQKQRLEAKLKLLAKTEVKVSSQTLIKKVSAEPVIAIKPAVIATPTVAEKPVIKKSIVETLGKSDTSLKLTGKETAISQLAPQKTGRPEWANSRFECLIFSVAGLKLAVPLISLGAIYKIEKDFIPLVGRASWFMGLYHHLDRNVRVIDTAQWVMPERCSEDVRLGYKFIIRLGGNDWGMACDAVHQSIQLYPDQVKWRTERTKRAWLFGTVIDHMCALIDADSLSSILNEQATRNPRIIS